MSQSATLKRGVEIKLGQITRLKSQRFATRAKTSCRTAGEPAIRVNGDFSNGAASDSARREPFAGGTAFVGAAALLAVP
eukprot:scaffold38619_cov38-Tisochrysis_lutea.AAC.1